MITAVKKVLETEKKAEQIIEKAEKDKEKIIEHARHAALQLISEEQKKVDESQEAFLQERQTEIDQKKEKILEQGQTAIGEIKRSADNNLHKAEAFIVKKLEESL